MVLIKSVFIYIRWNQANTKYKTSFQERWLSSDGFKSWLEKDPNDACCAICKVCAKTFSVANLGVKAVESHAKGDIGNVYHLQVKKTLKSVIESAEKPSNNTPPNLQQSLISTSCNASLARNAEVMWAVDVILSSCSYRSSVNKSNLFCGMFSDSEVAQNFSCGITKCGYLICFGISPYFKEQF